MSYKPRSDFLEVMVARGYLQDCTDLEGLDQRLRAGPVPSYIGYDATARSLHVGHLLNIMMLRWLQKTGHKPITLMGGGTTKVGDPSFRSDERPLLGPDEIAANIATMRGVFAKYLDYGETPTGAIMLDNAEWLDGLNYLDLPARHRPPLLGQPHARLREREVPPRPRPVAVVPRIQLHDPAGLRLPRASPPDRLFAADGRLRPVGQHRERHRPHPPRRRRGGVRPHLAAADHLGRPQDGQVRRGCGLAQRRGARPYDFWQFWRNTTDADVGRFLKLYTELPVEECDRLGRLGGSEINAAKIRLANEVTALCHGADAAAAAEATARAVFEQGGTGEELPTLALAPADVPDGGISILQLLVRSRLANSGKDARRLIAEGGARLDDEAVTDPGLHLDAAALAAPRKLSAGRKRHALVHLDG